MTTMVKSVFLMKTNERVWGLRARTANKYPRQGYKICTNAQWQILMAIIAGLSDKKTILQL